MVALGGDPLIGDSPQASRWSMYNLKNFHHRRELGSRPVVGFLVELDCDVQ